MPSPKRRRSVDYTFDHVARPASTFITVSSSDEEEDAASDHEEEIYSFMQPIAGTTDTDTVDADAPPSDVVTVEQNDPVVVVDDSSDSDDDDASFPVHAGAATTQTPPQVTGSRAKLMSLRQKLRGDTNSAVQSRPSEPSQPINVVEFSLDDDTEELGSNRNQNEQQPKYDFSLQFRHQDDNGKQVKTLVDVCANEVFKAIAERYAAKRGIPVSGIELVMDGDTIELDTETPESFDLEDGDLVDVK